MIEQNTQAWLNARLGMPTASNASKIVTSTGTRSKSLPGYAEYLAGCEWSGEDMNTWVGNAYTDKGHELEDEARRAYEFETDNLVHQVGFIEASDGTYGASPDGLIGDRGAVEIKCFTKSHVHVLAKHDGRVPAGQIAQINFQMLVCDLDWVDLYFYHEKLPTLRIHCLPDDAIQAGFRQYLPELLQLKAEILLKIDAVEAIL